MEARKAEIARASAPNQQGSRRGTPPVASPGSSGCAQAPGEEASRNADGSIWVFGYGSLVWRPAFPFIERERAFIEGWVRRFWQGSTDHRGTPEHPGRVVTLLPAQGAKARCWGMAYRVGHDDVPDVFSRLDHREKGGYDRQRVTLVLPDSERQAGATLYIATQTNENYLGPASLDDMARQILASVGPSGPNPEYVLELDRALKAIGGADPHVGQLAARLRQLQQTR